MGPPPREPIGPLALHEAPRGRGGHIRDHFSERASAYAAHRPTYPAALLDYLAGLAPRRELAWDCGCGSGQLSLPLAERFERVVATDASEAQLARAPRSARIDYRCAPAEASGLPGGSVDLATAAQAAHWFDLEAYYDEVRRVARPGCAVALVTYGNMQVGADLHPIVARFCSSVLGRWWPPERRHVEEGYRSLPFPFPEIDAPELQIAARWTLDDLAGYVRTWSATQAMERREGASATEAFFRELGRAWGDPRARRLVRWPVSLRAGRVEPVRRPGGALRRLGPDGGRRAASRRA